MTVTAWAGGAPGWTPFDLGPALLGYWDARAGVTGTTNVSSWKDRVAGYDMVQATAANQPAFSATGLNGDAAVVFDGADDYLSMESAPFPTGSAGSEIWAVADQQAMNTIGRNIINYGGGLNTSVRRLGRSTTSTALAAAGDGTVTFQALGSEPFVGRHVLRGRFDAERVRLQVDNGDMKEGTGTTNTGAVRTTIGATNTGAGSWLGAIAIVIITAPLTDAQAALLYTFLKDRMEGRR